MSSSPVPPPPPPCNNEAPSPIRILRVWLTLGLQSFGGGAATLALIQRAVVEEQQWVTEAEFARYWSLVQLAPGINLLALTILIGRKTGNALGIALALFGLLLPSAAITIVLTACYARVQHAPLVRAALSGVIPAVVGLGLVTAWQIARPLLKQSRADGKASLAVSLLLLTGSTAVSLLAHPPVIAILGISGSCGALWHWLRRRHGAGGEAS